MTESHNPLFEGADPFLMTYQGKYYIYATNSPDGFRVYVSDDLAVWKDKGYCLKKGDVIGQNRFWAPEVIAHKGKFYMVYASEEHLAIATSESPLGPFTQMEKKWLMADKAIDGHFFLDDGTLWLYYVRIQGENMIYVAKLNDDCSTLQEKDEKFLLRAEENWELKEGHVTEGPFVLKHKEKYYLSYSANDTRSIFYAIGYAVSDRPDGPFIKYKGNPILQMTERVNGVGHHSFARSIDGKDLLCAYHCHYSKMQNYPRQVCVDRAEFVTDAEGDDILVIHGPTVRNR